MTNIRELATKIFLALIEKGEEGSIKELVDRAFEYAYAFAEKEIEELTA